MSAAATLASRTFDHLKPATGDRRPATGDGCGSRQLRAGSARWGEAREALPSEGGRERPPLIDIQYEVIARRILEDK